MANESKVSVVYQCLASFSDNTNFGFNPTVAPKAVEYGFRETRSRVQLSFL